MEFMCNAVLQIYNSFLLQWKQNTIKLTEITSNKPGTIETKNNKEAIE